MGTTGVIILTSPGRVETAGERKEFNAFGRTDLFRYKGAFIDPIRHKRVCMPDIAALKTVVRDEEKMKMRSLLIKDTTMDERKQIVDDSLGNIDAYCDGCMAGLADMYQDYIDGKAELKDINMSFRANYVSGKEEPERPACRYLP